MGLYIPRHDPFGIPEWSISNRESGTFPNDDGNDYDENEISYFNVARGNRQGNTRIIYQLQLLIYPPKIRQVKKLKRLPHRL